MLHSPAEVFQRNIMWSNFLVRLLARCMEMICRRFTSTLPTDGKDCEGNNAVRNPGRAQRTSLTSIKHARQWKIFCHSCELTCFCPFSGVSHWLKNQIKSRRLICLRWHLMRTEESGRPGNTPHLTQSGPNRFQLFPRTAWFLSHSSQINQRFNCSKVKINPKKEVNTEKLGLQDNLSGIWVTFKQQTTPPLQHDPASVHSC